MHGAELQLGESRVKLVSFQDRSPQHERARAYLLRRDGLTGLFQRDEMVRAIEDERGYAEWANAPLAIARYHIRGPNRHVSERPTILEMLALRRAAQRVLELTEMLLLSLVPATAGRTGPLKFAVAMTGPSLEEARNVVEQVVSQVQGLMPEALDLAATLGAGRAWAKRPRSAGRLSAVARGTTRHGRTAVSFVVSFRAG